MLRTHHAALNRLVPNSLLVLARIIGDPFPCLTQPLGTDF